MRHRTTVVSGRGRGKRIGFPTINLAIPERLGGAHGIYAGWLHIAGKRHAAAVHFGPVPTFQEPTPTLEAYLLDAPAVALPTEVEIELVARVRDIASFAGAAELAAQIEKDVQDVRRLLQTHSPR